LFISSSVNIIGEAKVDKSKIVVDSGFYIVGKNVEGNVHLEHI
jgi:dihydropteroate synthase